MTGRSSRPKDSRPGQKRPPRTGPKDRGSTGTHVQPARRIAYEVISAVRSSDAYANLLLPVKLSRAKLSAADAGLATELTYGTLRMMGYYDRVIVLAAGRGVDAIDPEILDVLRLGLHQLLSMRVAEHAAVNESVILAQTVGSRSATGFTNAVLRTVTRSTPDEWHTRVLEATTDPDDRLSAEFSHPVWIVRALRQSLGAEDRGGELDEALAANNVAPMVNLVALPGFADGTEPPADAHPAHYSPVGFYSDGGDPFNIPGVKQKVVRVQDEGSQLAALALSRARPIARGERWLDLCAGPGGKAALLAAEAVAGGADLVANELVPARAELVRRALTPFGEAVQVWEHDGTLVGDTHAGAFDRILLDAPCTGLGALRRRPEARWRKKPTDVAALVALQRSLLDSAITALAPGGVLAYVTCSPHIGETRTVVAGAMKKHEAILRRLPTADIVQAVSLAPLDLAGDGLSVQLWPHRHGTDAMFIQLFEKHA
ncbi:RsmB/NOP family class I SAM-dependent RNA methyltransferase [Homoserinimonas sp. OAct 916]|uniref:RsmB/NOP family class I SAM-dependent RNA methyltransferase n=1 Tax=Homoserinimonas sp. OAct 916 TaxID=2211450 RepID=UPI000DBE8AE9|nr:transcription antitermination factor NusB [Homoserinimonas sp. OAct 916]